MQQLCCLFSCGLIPVFILFFATEDLSVCVLLSWLNWNPLKTSILKMEALRREGFSFLVFCTVLGLIPVFWDCYGSCGRRESSFTSSKVQFLTDLNTCVCVCIYAHSNVAVPAVGSEVGSQFRKLLSRRTFFTSSATSRQDIPLTL